MSIRTRYDLCYMDSGVEIYLSAGHVKSEMEDRQIWIQLWIQVMGNAK